MNLLLAKSWISEEGYAIIPDEKGVAQAWTMLPRPKGEVGNIRVAMELDENKELYDDIRVSPNLWIHVKLA